MFNPSSNTMKNFYEFLNIDIKESIHSSKNKMKDIVNDLLKKEIGGDEYFNSIDSSVKIYKNVDLIQDVFDEIQKQNNGDFNLVLTGGFGEWVLYMIKRGKLKIPKNLVLVNGSIRGKNNKLNKITTGKEIDIIFKKNHIENQKFILFDDSYYSGSTKKAIERYLKKYNSEIEKTFILYDGSDKQSNDKQSLYKYYDYHKGTKLSIEKLLNYLDQYQNIIPINKLKDKIIKGEIKTIREINIEIEKIQKFFNKNIVDVNNFSRREEIKYENVKIRKKMTEELIVYSSENNIRMNHLKSFEEMNEGLFKNFTVAGLLVLSTILPSSYVMSNNVVNDGNKIESIQTNKKLNKNDIKKIIKKLSKEGFGVTPDNIPLDIQLDKLPEDGNFILINTVSETITSANFMITQLINNNKEQKKKAIKLFKKNNKSIEVIAIVLLQ